MGVETQVILMIIIAAMGCGWLCKEVWENHYRMGGGRGLVITLAGSLVVLLLLSFTS